MVAEGPPAITADETHEDEIVDVTELADADVPASAAEKLTQAFPGAVVVEETGT